MEFVYFKHLLLIRIFERELLSRTYLECLVKLFKINS